MTDFVLEQKELMKESHQGFNIEKYDFIIKVCNYAKFLKQPLQLGFFVPCDLDGNVLEEPDFMSGYYDDNGFGDVDKYKYKKHLKEHQEAKERVLFEGFELSTNNTVLHKNGLLRIGFSRYPIVEDLIKYNLVLTESAKKQIGL